MKRKEPVREQLILGVDLGGTKILSAVATASGKILARDYRMTPAQEGPYAVIQAIFDSMRQSTKNAGIELAQLSGVGIGAAGACNPDTGVVSFSPHLPGWHNVPLRQKMEKEFGIKAFLLNDAKAAALGEVHFGAGKGARHLVYVALGTGIGGGIIIDGKLYSGAAGAAGEIGHMTIDVNGPVCECGNTGCWEVLASGSAIAHQAKQRLNEGSQTSILKYAGGNPEGITAQTVFAAAEQGDALARQLIGQASYHLGVGMVNLVNTFNPEVILIGGGLSNMGDMLLKPALKLVKERAFTAASESVRFGTAKLGADAAVLGAVVFARQSLGLDKPETCS